jgi:hypothetical protein
MFSDFDILLKHIIVSMSQNCFCGSNAFKLTLFPNFLCLLFYLLGA